MFAWLAPLREMTFLSIAIRLILAFLCGAVIGLEREFKRRPAGFRTHILICLGAAIATLTSQYLILIMHYDTDMTRLGAQVIAGIGFIGAGTIIVTRRQRVKGLTTAAGLWTAAIVGLSLGAGFFEGGLLVTFMVLFAELILSKMEYRISRNTPEINLYIEYASVEALDRILVIYREKGIQVMDMTVTRSAQKEGMNSCVIFSLRLPKSCDAAELQNILYSDGGIMLVEEL